MIEKGLYPYQGTMSEFLASPIRAFRLKRFFQWVIVIRQNLVKLFYKGYINEEQHYMMVKGQKVDFRPYVINELFGLEREMI